MFNLNLYLENIRLAKKGLNPYLDSFDITVIELGAGRARFQMPIRPAYLQAAGLMQGGLIVALADEAIAHAMMTELDPDEGLTTIELKSNFLSGISHGELQADAAVFKKGRNVMIGDCLVTSGEGKNICRVSATFMLLKKKMK